MHFKNPFRRIVVFMQAAMNSTSLDPSEEGEFDLKLFAAYLTSKELCHEIQSNEEITKCPLN